MLDKLSTSQRKLVNWLGLLIVVGIGFMLIRPEPSSLVAPESQNPITFDQQQTLKPSYEERIEQELRLILGKIQDVGAVDVFVTLERGPSVKVAETVTQDLRTIEEFQGTSVTRSTSDQHQVTAPVILRQDGERKEVPLVLEQYEPQIRGVLIVAEGATDSNVRYQIAKAVQTVLQISMYRIEVLPKVN